MNKINADTMLTQSNYTWYFESFSFIGGSNADIHWSHAPLRNIYITIMEYHKFSPKESGFKTEQSTIYYQFYHTYGHIY